jgi:sugar (pentulose or hexulose) kinase
LTADVCEREVLAGPVEATALGNVLVQALALGELADLSELRRVVADSTEPRHYQPHSSTVAASYARFLEAAGHSATRAARTPV